jgi:hypothetical protein
LRCITACTWFFSRVRCRTMCARRATCRRRAWVSSSATWDEAARDYERRLLAAFAEQHDGRRPFANLTG